MLDTATSGGGPGYIRYPDYDVSMQPFVGRIRVHIGETQLAESTSAILLTETDHSPVYYLPRADVRFDLLEALDDTTYCPFKGHATYWRVAGKGADHGKAVLWAYTSPFDEVSGLSEYVAFYSDRVRLEVV